MLRKLALAFACLTAWSLFGQQLVNDCNSCLVVAQATTHSNTLTWLAPAASTLTLTGYNVYRSAGACPAQPNLSTFTKLTTTPLATTALTYTDSGLAGGVTNCYAPTAVYGTVESGAGFYVQGTTPLTIAATPAIPPGQAPATITSN